VVGSVKGGATAVAFKKKPSFINSLSNDDNGRMKCFAKFWKPLADTNTTKVCNTKAKTNDHTIKRRWENISDVCTAIETILIIN